MATIEQCEPGARVRRKDGLHGEAVVVGRVIGGRIEGRVRRTSMMDTVGREDAQLVEVHYDQGWKDEDGSPHSGEALDADLLEVIRAPNAS